MAIHQPNLWPRLSTLAKIYAADCWIVLDDVQFARRDYQHRARIADVDDPMAWRWLSLPTHLPQGRATLIREARLVDVDRARRRMAGVLTRRYGSSPCWAVLRPAVGAVLDALGATDRTADIAELSTRVLLRMLGWRGRILHSSHIPTSAERSARLADLAEAVGANAYLCGTGGMRYLAPGVFTQRGIDLIPFTIPATGVWAEGRHLSALWHLARHGPTALADHLHLARKAT